MSRYQLIDTNTGEIVRELARRPRRLNRPAYRARGANQVERDIILSSALLVGLSAVLIIVR